MKRIRIVIALLAMILVSCSDSPVKDEISLEEIIADTGIDTLAQSETLPDGFQLLESTCFACHSPNPSNQNNVAPTISEIKIAYGNFKQEGQFIDAIQLFLANPSQETALMDDAVVQYGLMPQMSLQTSQSKAIAQYLYQNEIESGTWFTTEYPKEKERLLANKENMSYVDRGFEYAMATKSVLGKNLKGKINSEGTLAAVNFCNLKAVHFTDSMSAVYKADIKRVSDKPRNANNQANGQELAIINDFKVQLENGEEIIPVTIEEKNHVFGYYPIVTNDMCLKCHGEAGNIEEETASKIALLYPQDKATGYATKQLRGIWVVKMTK
ncbi:MAG: DUF3365 domain-containing protein [Crocinitomix sp.]|nr:DUF3365 domain-containing protein [Crocinitomix sp.]